MENRDLLLLRKDDDRENVMNMWFKDAGLELDQLLRRQAKSFKGAKDEE